MFRILKLDGTEVGVTESVNYIKYHERNQCYVSATTETAEGVAFNCVAYQLQGKPELKNAKDTVRLVKFDGGFELNKLIQENKKLQTIIAETDEAIIQIYEMMEKHNG